MSWCIIISMGIEHDRFYFEAAKRLGVGVDIDFDVLQKMHMGSVDGIEVGIDLPMFESAVRAVEDFRSVWLDKLTAVLEPGGLGVDVEWKESQKDLLKWLIDDIDAGFFRVVYQSPTGSGKAHFLSAVARSYIEALEAFTGRVKDDSVLLLTSRANLAEGISGFRADYKGELEQWFKGRPGAIRLVASGKSRPEKPTPIMARVYKGFGGSEKFQISPGLILGDEGHNITDAVQRRLNAVGGGAFSLMTSATVLGPRKQVPGYFLEESHPDVTQPHRELDISSLIERGELKTPVVYNGYGGISLGDDLQVLSETGDFSQPKLAEWMTKNIEFYKSFLAQIVEDEESPINQNSEKGIRDRRVFVPVPTVEFGNQLAEYCANELGIPSACVSGKTKDFSTVMRKVKNKEINIVFSAKKIGEGEHAGRFDTFLAIKTFAKSALWLLTQNLGRVMAIDPEDPGREAIIIAPSYDSAKPLSNVNDVFNSPKYEAGRDSGENKKKYWKRKLEERFTANPDLGLEEAFSDVEQEEMRDSDIDSVAFFMEFIRSFSRDLDISVIDEIKTALKDTLGIKNRTDLVEASVEGFLAVTFGDLGSPRDLLRLALGNTPKSVTKETLKTLADRIGWIEEDKYKAHLEVLRKKGITSWASLVSIDIDRFRKTEFPPFGFGNTLMNRVNATTNTVASVPNLELMSENLGFDKKTSVQNILAGLGIFSVEDLRSYKGGIPALKSAKLGDFNGKFMKLVRLFMGERLGDLTWENIMKFGDAAFAEDNS